MSSIFNQFFNQDKENRKPGKIDYMNNPPKDVDKIKITASVFGRVQGVGFRYATTQTAKNIGIDGSVQNEADGSVYTEAVGSKEQIEEFIMALAKGPSPSSKVERVEIKYDSSVMNYRGFGERH